MATLTTTMLRERRVHIAKNLVSREVKQNLMRLREQMGIYSYQHKNPSDTFGKLQVALSGKVGGAKDDLVICLQLGLYWSSENIMQKSVY